MKTIMLFLAILFSSEKEYVVSDFQTKENLVGVKIETKKDTFYTDFNGSITIKSKIKDVEYISYELKEIKNDTIYMIRKK